MQAERVTIENAQGDVTISRLVGASQVQVTDQLGNIALTLGEKADGYSVQAACGLGSITVSGAKQASPYSANSKAANAVILDAALGKLCPVQPTCLCSENCWVSRRKRLLWKKRQKQENQMYRKRQKRPEA